MKQLLPTVIMTFSESAEHTTVDCSEQSGVQIARSVSDKSKITPSEMQIKNWKFTWSFLTGRDLGMLHPHI